MAYIHFKDALTPVFATCARLIQLVLLSHRNYARKLKVLTLIEWMEENEWTVSLSSGGSCSLILFYPLALILHPKIPGECRHFKSRTRSPPLPTCSRGTFSPFQFPVLKITRCNFLSLVQKITTVQFDPDQDQTQLWGGFHTWIFGSGPNGLGVKALTFVTWVVGYEYEGNIWVLHVVPHWLQHERLFAGGLEPNSPQCRWR